MRYVFAKDVVSEMAKHTLPAWAKLAVNGAVFAGQVQLYSARGFWRAYVPEYAFDTQNSKLPPLRREREFLSFIDRYDLRAEDSVDGYVTAWHDSWETEPKHISIGWILSHEPIDWSRPVLTHEYFEIDGNIDAFGYDDLFPEGEPEAAPFYDTRFDDLCLNLNDAETLVPMGDFETIAFSDDQQGTSSRVGRPGGTGFAAKDMPLVEKMRADLRDNPSLTVREVASRYADYAEGGGTRDSKIKRLERRFKG